MKHSFAFVSSVRRRGWTLALAALVGACGLAASTAALAQATAGTIFGKAPAGSVVAAHNNNNGTQRNVHVGDDGRYALRALPVGMYTVTLEENGQPVAKHIKVPVVVGRGIKVDFDCAKGECGVAKQ